MSEPPIALEPTGLAPVVDDRPAAPAPRVRFRDSLVFLALYLGAPLLCGFGAGAFAGARAVADGFDTGSDAFQAVLASYFAPAAVLGLVLGAVAVAAYARRILRGPEASEVRSRVGLVAVPASQLGRGLAFGVLGSIAANAFLQATAPPPPDYAGGPLQQAMTADGTASAWLLACALFVAPPLEEFLFRGHLLAALEHAAGATVAVVLSTALFLVLHVTEVTGYLPSLLGLAVLSVAVVWLRYRSRSIWPAVACHVGYNGVYVLATILA